MKIIHKLVLVIIIGLGIIVSLGWGAYYATRNINETFDELVELPIPSILRLSNMTEAFILSVDGARSYRLYGTKDAKEAYETNKHTFDVLLDELKKDLGYGTSSIPPEDVALIDALATKSQELSAAIEASFEEFERNGDEGEQAVDAFRSQEDEIIALLGQYRDLEEAEIVSAHEETKQKTNKINNLLLFLMVLFVVFYVAINGFLVRSIIKPLTKLTEVAREFGNGNMDKRLTVSAQDELGVVVAAFNSMADNIQQSNMDLENQVQARTTQMKKQLEELERMNTLMIDRELKMIELKKQNRELQNSLEMHGTTK